MQLENAPCGFISFRPDGTLVQINKTLLKWLGYAKEELLPGAKFNDIISPAGRLYYQMYIYPLLSMQGSVNEISIDLMSSAKIGISCLFNATFSTEDDATPIIHASLFNITDRKKYEVELFKAKSKAEDEKKRFEFLANTLPNILWTMFPTGKIDFLNKRYFEYFNANVSSNHLYFLRNILRHEEMRSVYNLWKDALVNHEEMHCELKLKRDGSSFNWYFVRIIPYKDPQGNLIMWLGSCTDIHAQKELQLKVLSQLNEQLARTSTESNFKTNVLKELAFKQSHIVRSPVAKILGLLNLLNEQEVNDEIRFITSLLHQSASELDNIIKDIVQKTNAVEV